MQNPATTRLFSRGNPWRFHLLASFRMGGNIWSKPEIFMTFGSKNHGFPFLVNTHVFNFIFKQRSSSSIISIDTFPQPRRSLILWLFFKRKQLLEIKIALVLKWLPEGGVAMARPWRFRVAFFSEHGDSAPKILGISLTVVLTSYKKHIMTIQHTPSFCPFSPPPFFL